MIHLYQVILNMVIEEMLEVQAGTEQTAERKFLSLITSLYMVCGQEITLHTL